MNPLHKDDIEILDLIINQALKKGKITTSELPEIKVAESTIESESSFEDRLVDNKLTYYRRLFEIIKERKSASVKISGYSYNIYPIPVITKRFVDNGGFKNLYEKQQEELRRTEILKRKEIDDAKISKWTKRTYWFTFGFAIAGLIIAIWAFVRTF